MRRQAGLAKKAKWQRTSGERRRAAVAACSRGRWRAGDDGARVVAVRCCACRAVRCRCAALEKAGWHARRSMRSVGVPAGGRGDIGAGWRPCGCPRARRTLQAEDPLRDCQLLRCGCRRSSSRAAGTGCCSLLEEIARQAAAAGAAHFLRPAAATAAALVDGGLSVRVADQSRRVVQPRAL